MADKQQIMSRYVKVGQFPTIIDDIHESEFRSFHVLRLILEMIEREDSKDTIMEVMALLSSYPQKAVNKKEVTKVMDLDEENSPDLQEEEKN